MKDYDSDGKRKLKTALKTYNKYFPNLDAYIISGDLTENGSQLQYDNFINIFNKYSKKDAKLLTVMGNHDYWNELSADEAQKRFENNMETKINTHTILKGYDFINISSENGDCHGTFNENLIQWLKKELNIAKNRDAKKPIFINVHQHIKNTVYGSDLWGNDSLYKVLKDYPQVIVFSGHSHYDINDERSIHQKDFTSVGTSSISYTELEPGKIEGSIPKDFCHFSQGLAVKVYEDNTVEIQRLDFHNNTKIKKPWIIKEPSKKELFTYTDNRKNLVSAPYFNKNATVKINRITSNSATIAFTQGKHEDFVQSYRIELLNEDNKTFYKNLFTFSDFYLGLKNMKNSLTVTLPNLNSNTKYEIKIYAIESFGKESTN
ncbi:metallophosphoesterase, partial [Clostridium tarantellae]